MIVSSSFIQYSEKGKFSNEMLKIIYFFNSTMEIYYQKHFYLITTLMMTRGSSANTFDIGKINKENDGISFPIDYFKHE